MYINFWNPVCLGDERRAGSLGMGKVAGILAERYLDGFHQKLVRRAYGTRWECDCAEFQEIKPLSPGAWCEHVRRCGEGAR